MRFLLAAIILILMVTWRNVLGSRSDYRSGGTLMEIILSIIGIQLQGQLTIIGLTYFAFAAIMAIGAWSALRD